MKRTKHRQNILMYSISLGAIYHVIMAEFNSPFGTDNPIYNLGELTQDSATLPQSPLRDALKWNEWKYNARSEPTFKRLQSRWILPVEKWHHFKPFPSQRMMSTQQNKSLRVTSRQFRRHSCLFSVLPPSLLLSYKFKQKQHMRWTSR